MKTTHTQKFDALTGARWLFASFVFIYHNRKYWRNDLNKYVLQFFNELHVGVSLFFILSGFLIAYKYNDPAKRKAFKYGNYISLRLARIVPLYWLLLLVSYIDWGFPKSYQTFLTFSLLHGFSDRHNLDGIAQAWSLSVEMTFYLFAPFIFIFLNKKWWKAILFLLILFTVALLTGKIWHAINGNKQDFFYPVSFIIHSTFFGRCPEFMAGILLAGVMHGDYKKPFSKIKHNTWIGFAGMMACVFLISFFQPDIFHHGNDTVAGCVLQYIFIPAFAITWLYGLMHERTWISRLLSNKFIVLLGNASFAFYLVHISYVNIRIRDWKLFPDRNYVILWALSILLYLLFEKPVNDLFRKLLRKKRTAPSLSPVLN